MSNKLNDAPILDQMDGHWQKLAMLILHKTVGTGVVRITMQDMKALEQEFAPGSPIIFTHGTVDAIELSLVTEARAAVLAAHQAGQQGRG